MKKKVFHAALARDGLRGEPDDLLRSVHGRGFHAPHARGEASGTRALRVSTVRR